MTTDGYDIVEQFLRTHSFVLQNLERSISSPHTGDLIRKYFTISKTTDITTGRNVSNITAYDDCPVWVLLECLTFGDLLEFYSFYAKSRSIPLPAQWSTLNLVRNLRNGASHDVCLLCHLPAGNSVPSREINLEIKKIATISTSQRQKKLSSRTLHEFAALVYLYSLVVHGNVRLHRIDELKDLFFNRIPEKKDFFKNNALLVSSYQFCCEVIKNLLFIP
ncbi:Abi family protein [Butyrivibrio sp. AC2005]|uniref:Abi family protein n=1 Tax=Butyrivibrio sp. AC2005 TaxID=1280672 RepID=UPI000416997F|nr:Abi family protein [Butyrivibrio sp. AC2005]